MASKRIAFLAFECCTCSGFHEAIMLIIIIIIIIIIDVFLVISNIINYIFSITYFSFSSCVFDGKTIKFSFIIQSKIHKYSNYIY